MMDTLRRNCAFLWVLSLATIACTPAQAQGPPEDVKLADKQQRVIEKIQIIRAWKLTEVLDLDASNGPALMETLSKYDVKLFAAHRSLRQAERALRKAMRKQAPEEELERLLEDAIRQRKELDRLRYEQLEEAGKTLDVRRRVKLYHFMPKFEQRIRKRLRKPGGLNPDRPPDKRRHMDKPPKRRRSPGGQ